jgi:hypothetical protein
MARLYRVSWGQNGHYIPPETAKSGISREGLISPTARFTLAWAAMISGAAGQPGLVRRPDDLNNLGGLVGDVQ